jgi:TolA-binding protein
MKRIWLAAALVLSVSGCTGKEAESPSAPDPTAAIIAGIQGRMSDLERNNAGELAAMKGTLDNNSKESKAAVNDLQQQILLKEQRIAGLETRIQQLESEIRGLKQAQKEKETEPPANPPLTQADPFPIRIFGVEGLKVVTGDHTTVRQVDTGEIGKDSFGDKVKQTRTESVQVDDYGYQARFSVENPTQAPVEISVSAGSKSETFTVPAGQAVSNLAVDSAMGADLTVMVGEHTRRFPITY